MSEKNEEETLFDYQMNVYTSLMTPVQFMGIGELAAGIIACFTTVLCLMVSKFCIVLGIAAFFILKAICKNEPNMVDFLADNLSQSDAYYA